MFELWYGHDDSRNHVTWCWCISINFHSSVALRFFSPFYMLAQGSFHRGHADERLLTKWIVCVAHSHTVCKRTSSLKIPSHHLCLHFCLRHPPLPCSLCLSMAFSFQQPRLAVAGLVPTKFSSHKEPLRCYMEQGADIPRVRERFFSPTLYTTLTILWNVIQLFNTYCYFI